MVDMVYTDKPYAPDESNHSKKSIEKLTPDGTLLVSDIFYTIQGEGPFAGRPALFIRLAGCNRGTKSGGAMCAGCDAAFQVDNATVMSYKEIRKKARILRNESVILSYGSKIDIERIYSNNEVLPELVVITGGEPMLHKNLPDFITHMLLKEENKPHFQIETNGDFFLNDLAGPFLRWNVSIVFSPKVGIEGYLPIKDFGFISTNHYYKFLISGEPESDYYAFPETCIAQLVNNEVSWDGIASRLYLSPIAYYNRSLNNGEIASTWDPTLINVERTARSYKRAAELVMAYPFLKLSTQTHLTISKA